jgi:hypothetical protein
MCRGGFDVYVVDSVDSGINLCDDDGWVVFHHDSQLIKIICELPTLKYE